MTLSTQPPGPKSKYPGELLLGFQRNPTGFLSRLARDYGDIVYFRLGPFCCYLVNHPDVIQDILVTHNRNFTKGRGHKEARRVLGDGLLTSEGDMHLRQRRLIQPVFHRRHLETFNNAILELTSRTSAGWRPGETRDISRDMWDLTLRIIARTLFNSTVESEADEISRALADLTRMFNPLALFFVEWLTRVPNPWLVRYESARARLDEKIYRAGGHTGDLPMLLHSAQADTAGKEVLTDRQVRDEALTVFLAGLGTTSYALSRTWYLLSQHPEVEARFHAEIDRVREGEGQGTGDLNRLVYTRRVIAEAMRLYPPAWITDREPIEDYEACGYRIPAGSMIILSQWVTHHDSRYFPDPFQFDPDRWLPERERRRPEFSYFPFGGGPRLCIGEPMAWISSLLILSTIGRDWRLLLSTDHPLDLVPRFSWDPKDTMFMRLARR